MSPRDFLTPFRRDALLLVIAVLLISGPLWVYGLQLNEPTYRYERVEVHQNGSTVEYVDRPAVHGDIPISDEIACSKALTGRVCAFERFLTDNRTLRTGLHSSNPNSRSLPGGTPHEYVLANESVYRATVAANESAQRDDVYYPIELALEEVQPEEALQDVSLSASADIPSAVAEAARAGTATTHERIDVPETPIRLEGGVYYRVYYAGEETASRTDRLLDAVRNRWLAFICPLLGLSVLVYVSRRFEITHIGD